MRNRGLLYVLNGTYLPAWAAKRGLCVSAGKEKPDAANNKRQPDDTGYSRVKTHDALLFPSLHPAGPYCPCCTVYFTKVISAARKAAPALSIIPIRSVSPYLRRISISRRSRFVAIFHRRKAVTGLASNRSALQYATSGCHGRRV